MLTRQIGLAALIPLLLVAIPGSAQVRVAVRVELPVLGNGSHPPVVRRPPSARRVVVREYNRKRHGNWSRRGWTPVILWRLDGRYYDRALPHAVRVLVYQHRQEYVLIPPAARIGPREMPAAVNGRYVRR